MLVVDVDDDGFIGFGARAALVLAIEDTGAADAEFETLAAHRLDQHAELKLAPPRDLDTVLVGPFGDADRTVGLRLNPPPLAVHAARDLAALAPRHRRNRQSTL